MGVCTFVRIQDVPYSKYKYCNKTIFYSLKKACLTFSCQHSYLKHVIDDVELYDRLSPYQMIHHRVVNIVHHEVADDQYNSFENVTYLSRL